MKKIATLIVLSLSGGVVAAQDLIAEPQKSNVFPINNDRGHTPGVHNMMQGDTLFYFEGYNFFVADPNDAASFSYSNLGDPSKTVAAALSSTPFASSSGFVFFYKIGTANDTTNYIGATSWYLPIAQADNWFTFGPVTVPATGATLKWKHAMPHAYYRDGYEVKVSVTGMQPSHFSPGSTIYNIADQSASTLNDTVFNAFESISLPVSYSGQQVYVAFHHNANNQFILYLDEILMIEGVTTGVKEAGLVSVSESRPNPAADHAWINYALKSSQPVTITIYDIAGKEVVRLHEGTRPTGAHTVKVDVSPLPAGIYYYTIDAGGHQAVRKMVVSK